MKKYSILFLSFLVFILLSISVSLQVKLSSPIGEFNATPDKIFLNWTNFYREKVTIANNASYSLDIEVVNDTTDITGNYSQKSRYYPGKYDSKCFFVTSSYDSPLEVENSTGSGNVEYNVTPGTTFNFTLIHSVLCPPGKYFGSVTIQNYTNSSENLDITVSIDVLITVDNELNSTKGFGLLKGVMSANASTYHSYYFNTSDIKIIENSTAVYISLSSLSKDLDLFLFDESGNLVAKDISKGTSGTGLTYNYLPTGKIWEIRIYGNFTSGSDNYDTAIYFTTLNATNTDDPAQQFNKIYFGDMNIGDKKIRNVTLKNEGSLDLKTVTESKELYHVDMENGNSVPKNFTFLIPSFSSEIIASLNWTGASHYNLTLYKPDGTFVNSSSDKRKNVNVTKAMQEEFIITKSITQGFWKVSVQNITNASYGDPYTVTVKFKVNDADILNWIKTNYTTQEFNGTGSTNSTQNFHFNFTVLNNTFAGKYEGFLDYNGYYGSKLRIPLEVNVTTPELVVNGSLQYSTLRITDNIGFNTTRQIIVLINNTGNKDLTIDSNSSSPYLNYSSNYMEFTFDYPSSTIASGNTGNLNINIAINTSKTNNVAQIYRGWIYLYDSDSRPYNYFNLTVEVNLTNRLRVNVINVISEDGDNMIENVSRAENVTVEARVYYLNESGTEIKENLNSSNLKAWLIEGNASYRVPSSGYLSLYNNSGGTVWSSPLGPYNPNVTIPADIPGGRYYVHLGVDYYPNNVYLIGDGAYHPLIINNTGLNLTTVTATYIEIDEYDVTYFNATVVNYGLLSPDRTLTMDSCSYATIEAYSYNDTKCFAMMEASNRRFTFDDSSVDETINPNGAEVCEFSWKITGKNVSSPSQTCSNMKIVASDSNFGDLTFTIKVEDTEGGGETTTTTSPGVTGTTSATTSTTTTTSTTIPSHLDITSYPSTVSVEQGKSKTESVKVKNTNTSISQTVTLSVSYLNSSWYNIPSPTGVIKKLEIRTYTVNFTIPEDAAVDDYDAKFNASSSIGSAYKAFTLSVTPGAEMKVEIDANLSYYQSQLTELEEELNRTKARGYNTSEAETIFENLKDKINDALELKDEDDYKGCYDLFDDIESLLNQTRTAIRQASGSAGDWWSWGKYVIIVAVGVGAAFLGYLFWPTPSVQPKAGLVPRKIEAKDRFSGKFQELKNKWKELRQKATEKGNK